MDRRRIIALLVSTTLLATACTALVGEAASSIRPTTTTTSTTTTAASTGATTSSGVTGPPEFVPDPIEWESCGGRLRCATLAVPLDYDDPTGASMTLSLNQLPARRSNGRIGALLVNPGGPGGSGLEMVADGIDLPSAVLDRFDIVGFDPRGVGASTPLQCGKDTIPEFRHLDSSPDSAAEQTELEAAAKAVVDDCQAAAGNLLPHVGTDDVVRDMNTIRQALGEEQLNYLGYSYGTLLGLRFAELFPQRARAIVLDGVVDPTQDFRVFLREQAIAFDEHINATLDACPAGKSDCPPGGAAAAYDEVARRVESAPISGASGETLGPSELATAALVPEYQPSAVPVFYGALSDALQGDGSRMLRLSAAYEESADYASYAAVECIDSPHPVGSADYQAFADELEALSLRFGGAIANELLPCAFWPAAVKSIVGPVTAAGAPPILVIGTTGDAATPYEQAVRVAQTLQNARLLTFEGDGHTSFGKSDCIADAQATYFVDLTLPPEGTTCTR